jgi:pSer/pThr/pTyr-binding forkhead associated (FHA) protein
VYVLGAASLASRLVWPVVIRIVLVHLCGSRATETDVVCRYHARLAPSSEATVSVADLGSRNGTWLNGTRIDQPTPVRTGDVIRLGSTGPELRVAIDEGV